MKIPVFLIGIALSAYVAIQGWTLHEVMEVKVEVAAMKQQIAMLTEHIRKNN